MKQLCALVFIFLVLPSSAFCLEISSADPKSSALIGSVKASASLAQAPFIINNVSTPACICVTSGSCALAGGNSNTNDGSGSIDVRIINYGTPTSPTTTAAVTAVSSGITTTITSQSYCPIGLDRCCPPNGYQCGIRYPPIASAPVSSQGQAAYGAYPWQAVLLSTGDVFQGSGALIDNFHIITAAHKVINFVSTNQQLKARLGEWNAAVNTEPLPAQEYFISRYFIHPQFTGSNLKNDIAILRLTQAVSLGQVPTIGTVCLPSNQISNQRCWIAGWGKSDFTNTGQYQAILKEVDVPLVDSNTCQNQLRATRLGANFVLDTTSFICAGGEPTKACTGDGGSPLVCNSGGKWFVMGLVAWGISCGQTNVPGVYVNVASYISWIQATTRAV